MRLKSSSATDRPLTATQLRKEGLSSVIGCKETPQKDAQEEAQEDVEADSLATAAAGQVASGTTTPRFSHITFLSDYGLTDEFVAVCKAVMGEIAPHAAILDITHNIRPFAIREAAVVLSRAVPFLPRSVHLAVVDPGVGSKRRAIAVRTAEGSLLVGPDNGLLQPALNELGGAEACRELTNRALMLPETSATFHGRDIFAPVVAHLADGIAFEEVGPSVEVETLVHLPPAESLFHGDHVHAEILHVDAFGNVQLSVRTSELPAVGLVPGTIVEVRLSDLWLTAAYTDTFASVSEGDWVLTEDSRGWLCISINRGNAALTLRVEAGEEVLIGPPGFSCSKR